MIFPNLFGGGPLLTAQAVQDLQSQHGFSDALAQFYLRQNGFNSQAMDADPEAAQAFLQGGEANPPCAADLARLFVLNADKAHMDLGGDGVQPVCWFVLSDWQKLRGSCVGATEVSSPARSTPAWACRWRLRVMRFPSGSWPR